MPAVPLINQIWLRLFSTFILTDGDSGKWSSGETADGLGPRLFWACLWPETASGCWKVVVHGETNRVLTDYCTRCMSVSEGVVGGGGVQGFNTETGLSGSNLKMSINAPQCRCQITSIMFMIITMGLFVTWSHWRSGCWLVMETEAGTKDWDRMGHWLYYGYCIIDRPWHQNKCFKLLTNSSSHHENA